MGVLFRTGLRRGLLGGSRVWTVVAVSVAGVRLLKKLAGGQPEVVFRRALRPGEALVVSTRSPSSGKAGRAVVRSSR